MCTGHSGTSLPTCAVLGLGAQPARRRIPPPSVGGRLLRSSKLSLIEAACRAMLRTSAEWRAHPHGSGLAALGPVVVSRIGDAPARPVPATDRPLERVRVLDASSSAGRTDLWELLAENGAM